MPRLPLELGRIIALAGLGLVTAPLGRTLLAGSSRLDIERVLLPGIGLAVITVLFVVVALIGRLTPEGVADQPTATLGIEAVLAGLFALVPASAWMLRLGLGNPVAEAAMHGRLQVLAAVWLAVVVVTALRLRTARKATGKQAIFT